MEKEKILGIDVCVTTYEELRNAIKQDIQEKKKSYIVTINPEKVIKAKKDESLKDILNNAKYQIPDGIGIIYASKIKKGKIKSRITGIDTMEMICDLSNKENFRIFMYGAEAEVVEKAKEKLKEKYKNINICGYINGYEKNEEAIIKKINTSKPDILFVALGSPKQEKFIAKNFSKINTKILLGVGGSFDVISGKKKRAPKWVQKKGLEWLYRLIKEPKRFFRQTKIISFIFEVMLQKNNKKNN